MATGFLNISWIVWGGLALLIALIFVVFIPSANKVNATTGTTFIMVRWFHSLCWALLALNFFLRELGSAGANGVANLLAAAGGIAYLFYLVSLARLAKR